MSKNVRMSRIREKERKGIRSGLVYEMLSDTDIDGILQPIYNEMALAKSLVDLARITDLLRKKAITFAQWSTASAIIRKRTPRAEVEPRDTITQRRGNVLTLFRDGIISKETLSKELSEIAQQSRRLNSSPSIAPPPPVPRILPPPLPKHLPPDIIYNELMHELDREDVTEVRRIKRREEKRRSRARKYGYEPPAYVNALLAQSAQAQVLAPPPQYA